MGSDQIARRQGAATGRPAFNPARVNAWFDLALGGLLVGAGVSAYFDTTIHITLATAWVAGVVVHLGLHWRWIAAAAGRFTRLPASTRRKALLALLLTLTCLPLALSGAVVALIYAPQVSDFHTMAFYALAGLLLGHLALSWRWIVARLRRRGAGA